jgi:hypothetical protein
MKCGAGGLVVATKTDRTPTMSNLQLTGRHVSLSLVAETGFRGMTMFRFVCSKRITAAVLSWIVLASASAQTAMAESVEPAWGAYAGRHLGNAEAAGTCPGYKINGARRDEILKIIEGSGLKKVMDATRTKQRADRELAIRKDSSVCQTLLTAYGPKGIVSKNYVLPTGTADLRETPAFERGIEMGLDPRQLERFQWAVQAVSAAAILANCRGYELVPLAEGYISTVKDDLDPSSLLMMGQSLEKSFGKIGSAGFCAKILADYGPGSGTPIMMKAKR